MSADISIIICTRNRADSLRETLESIARCIVPENTSIELLIVDNGSTDRTRDIVDQVVFDGIDKRYVIEPTPGKAHAYNRGFAETSGDVLLSTDDDVRVPLDWIGRMCEPIQSRHADLVAGGVRLAPHLIKPWMTKRDRVALADSEGLDQSRPPLFIGANFAMHRSVLARVPEFEPELGPGAIGCLDDGFFALRCNVAAFRIRYLLDVIVEHHPDPRRVSYDALLRTAVSWGRAAGWLQHHWEHGRLKWPHLRRMHAQVRRTLLQISESHEPDSRPSDAAWARAHAYGLCDQYLIERGRPYLYDRLGLRRRVLERVR